MEAIDDVKGGTLLEFAKSNIDEGSTIRSDGLSSYNALQGEYTLEPKAASQDADPEWLKWAHTIISNAKAFIEGTFHGLGRKYIQRYLNEFCYRFNRRDFRGQGFYRLLNACVCTKTITLAELRG
jgi:hypothetical protein